MIATQLPLQFKKFALPAAAPAHNEHQQSTRIIAVSFWTKAGQSTFLARTSNSCHYVTMFRILRLELTAGRLGGRLGGWLGELTIVRGEARASDLYK